MEKGEDEDGSVQRWKTTARARRVSRAGCAYLLADGEVDSGAIFPFATHRSVNADSDDHEIGIGSGLDSSCYSTVQQEINREIGE